MSSLAEQYDRIERYLHGAMTPGELDEFTKQLSKDPELAKAVELHRELGETLAGEGVHQLRQTLQQVNSQWKNNSGGGFLRILKSPRVMAIAASLLLLIGFFAWYGHQGPSLESLADANFAPLPLQTQMGSYEDEDIPKIRNEANQAYIARNYAKAAELFEELARLEPFNLNNQLFAGICRLGNRQPDEAIAALQPLADGDDQHVQSEASWYLALAFMKTGNLPSTRSYLSKVVEVKGYSWQKAAGILRNL